MEHVSLSELKDRIDGARGALGQAEQRESLLGIVGVMAVVIAASLAARAQGFDLGLPSIWAQTLAAALFAAGALLAAYFARMSRRVAESEVESVRTLIELAARTETGSTRSPAIETRRRRAVNLDNPSEL